MVEMPRLLLRAIIVGKVVAKFVVILIKQSYQVFQAQAWPENRDNPTILLCARPKLHLNNCS